MRRSHRQPEASWTVLGAVAANVLIVFATFYGGGAAARRFGLPQPWVALVALALVAVFNMVRLLVRELPRQGLPFLRRWLMFSAWVSGYVGTIWSATQIRYDRWAVLYGSLHVFVIIVLTVVFGWVCDGRKLGPVVFGPPAKTDRKSSSGDDSWLE